MSGVYGVFLMLSGVWGNIIGSAFLNPWSIEKHNIESSEGDYVFTDERVLSRVPYIWLILAGLLFLFLFPGWIFIENEELHDCHVLQNSAERELEEIPTEVPYTDTVLGQSVHR